MLADNVTSIHFRKEASAGLDAGGSNGKKQEPPQELDREVSSSFSSLAEGEHMIDP